MNWNSVYSLIPIFFSSIGIILTAFIAYIFYLHIDTPIVKASSRELCCILFLGFICNFLMTFSLLARTTTAICGLRRFGVGLSFSVMYSPILVKTNRTSRIFYKATKSAKRPAFISKKSQLIITLILVLIQMIFGIFCFIISPPEKINYQPEGKRDKLIALCKIEDIHFLISLSYNLLLIIVCTFYAVKTRKIPKNFNESKFIGFTMYSTCITWLGFLPLYFGTANNFEVLFSFNKIHSSFFIFFFLKKIYFFLRI